MAEATTTARAQNYIRNWRNSKNLTVYQLGELAGISGSMVAQIERGRSTFTDRTLAALAAALQIEPWKLLAYPPEEEALFLARTRDDNWPDMHQDLKPIADRVYKLHIQQGRELALAMVEMVGNSVNSAAATKRKR